MTPGHKHRTVRLARIPRILQTPLLTTEDRERAERSRWVWGAESVGHPMPDGRPEFPDVYVLTPLSILHTLFGLAIKTQEKP